MANVLQNLQDDSFTYFRSVLKRILLLLLLLPTLLHAQNGEKIELLNADVSEFDEAVNAGATRLIGHVSFRHNGALMNCDSAYLYRETNSLEAFGSISIRQGDTLTLTGKRLLYNGNTRSAQVFDDVVMRDRKMTMNTSRLDYDMQKEIAYYTDSAHIISDENILTSKSGYYYSANRDLFFKRDVKLVNPKYTMDSDTLRYNTVSKTAFFLGPTFIRSDENLIYCELGWYNTLSQQSSFKKNAYLQSKEQILKGDSLYYNRQKGIGKVFRNVFVSDTVNKVIVTGNYGEYHELTDSSWVVGNAVMMQLIEDDTLFMHADTLLSAAVKDTTIKGKNLFAFHGVRLFKKDLQGICDSLVYQFTDSTIHFYINPVLWSGLNQLTSDSIYIQMSGSSIKEMYLNNNAFISSIADSNALAILDSIRYNQIKGKRMTGFFYNNELYKIDVNGNGQTIYYAKNKQEKNFAVNRADCSDLRIYVSKNNVESILLLNDPDGTLYPIKSLSINELRLKDFQWFGDLRPKSKEDIFKSSKKMRVLSEDPEKKDEIRDQKRSEYKSRHTE